ncbi:MAG: class I SAM-dependent RNA methyltransferase [Pseudomonadota bacterium]
MTLGEPNSLTIERLGHQGDGIASGPIFVQRALPGEVVAGQVEEGRLKAPRILTPSSHRVKAPCRHYQSCGGCALQHADDGFVTSWKEEVVRSALEAHGLTASFRPAHVSPPRSRRRARLTGRRVKSGALVGFHGARSDTITAVPDCEVLVPEIVDLLPLMKDLTRLGASRKSVLTFAATATETGCDLAVEGGNPIEPALREAVFSAVADQNLARLTWNGDRIAQWTTPLVQFGPASVPVPPGAFLQATKSGERALTNGVIEAVGGAIRIADLFAGCGTFSLPLAQFAEVHAVEGETSLTAALDKGWRHATGLKRVTSARRDLFRSPLSAEELEAYQAVVIDPPRAGAAAQMEALASSSVPRVAAVSCNPVTFARDAAILREGDYRLEWVQVVDQFRWSAHVELVAGFSRKGSS